MSEAQTAAPAKGKPKASAAAPATPEAGGVVTPNPAAAKKPATEYTEIKMDDGRTVKFAGKRQADKTVKILDDGAVVVTIDFRNGKTVSLNSATLSAETRQVALGHGLSQKIGDEYSGEKDVDDMTLAAEAMVKRLTETGWSAPKEAGDSFAGASVVIRALCEVTGKSVDDIKAFLDKKLETAKAAGQKLTRNDLYQSFRNPTSKTGQVIKRLEDEKLSKAAKFNSDDLLAEIG